MPLHTILRGLVDLIAPPRCAACELVLEPGGEGFCGGCEPLLERLSGAESAMAAFRYGGPLADAMRRFKYGGQSQLARPLAILMLDRARSACAGLDAIVPVPLHPRRLRERGFDQTCLIAGELARSIGIPRRLDLLSRPRATATQASLDRAGRLANVHGAFVASPGARGLRVLLLDDVRTTGATLADAGRALLSAGALGAHSLALALADDDVPGGEGTAARRN